MKETGSTFSCEKGLMQLSENLAYQLKERFENRLQRSYVDANLIRPRRWICAVCVVSFGQEHVDSHDEISCINCGSKSVWFETVWYCPQCGVPIGKDCANSFCTVCGKDLKSMCFQLVDLHPHI